VSFKRGSTVLLFCTLCPSLENFVHVENKHFMHLLCKFISIVGKHEKQNRGHLGKGRLGKIESTIVSGLSVNLVQVDSNNCSRIT